MNTIADDNTIMAFGQYEGEKLANVPASYLIWCKNNISKSSSTYKENKDIFEYINENLEDLKLECKNG